MGNNSLLSCADPIHVPCSKHQKSFFCTKQSMLYFHPRAKVGFHYKSVLVNYAFPPASFNITPDKREKMQFS